MRLLVQQAVINYAARDQVAEVIGVFPLGRIKHRKLLAVENLQAFLDIIQRRPSSG